MQIPNLGISILPFVISYWDQIFVLGKATSFPIVNNDNVFKISFIEEYRQVLNPKLLIFTYFTDKSSAETQVKETLSSGFLNHVYNHISHVDFIAGGEQNYFKVFS